MSFVMYGFHIITSLTELHIASWIERFCRYFPSYVFGATLGIRKVSLNTQSANKKVLAVLAVVLSAAWIFVGKYLSDALKNTILFLSPSYSLGDNA